MKILKSKIIRHSVIALVATVILTAAFEFTISVDFFNPVTSTFKDFDLSDIIASKLGPDDNSGLTDIIIVHIENTRTKIAKQLEILDALNPKIIGVDAFFFDHGYQKEDTLLYRTLRKMKNVVLANSFGSDPSIYKSKDSLSKSIFKGSKNIRFGFVNIYKNVSSNTVRAYLPYVNIGDSIYNSFSAEILKIADKRSYDYLLSRGNDNEVINFRNDVFIQIRDFSKMDKDSIRNKIVLLGYLGSKDSDCEDKFYTPLNKRNIGRTLPDMYGVVIHANILSMNLNRKYINNISNLTYSIVLFLVLISNVYLIVWLKKKLKNHFE